MYVIKLYPQTPKTENGYKVTLLNDHMLDIGVQGKPHKILPLAQSKNEKIKVKAVPKIRPFYV